jgi:tRNA threonylcarbamoyladenosine biosynthesis protein TsaB
MVTLAIETTGEHCSIAVTDDAGLLVERVFRHRMRLLQRLVPDALAVLADAGVTLTEVDLFAVGLGPGSFTGVRLGVMTAKAWADALSRPVVGVSTLEAIAEEHRAVQGVLIPMVRARPGEVYAAAYATDGAARSPLADARVYAPSELASLAQTIGAQQVVLCGDGVRTCGDAVDEALRAVGIRARFGQATAPRASTVAAIARERAAAGRSSNAIDLTPCYITAPSIRLRAG